MTSCDIFPRHTGGLFDFFHLRVPTTVRRTAAFTHGKRLRIVARDRESLKRRFREEGSGGVTLALVREGGKQLREI